MRYTRGRAVRERKGRAGLLGKMEIKKFERFGGYWVRKGTPRPPPNDSPEFGILSVFFFGSKNNVSDDRN
jgi:hypothetical protein